MAERKLPSVEDYPSNAIGVKNESVKHEPPERLNLKGGVKRRRSNIFREVGNDLREDAPSIGEHLLYDILLPALRDLISDMGHGALDMAMGTETRRYGKSYGRGNSYISYDRYYDDRNRRRRDRDEDRERERGRRRNRDLSSFVFEYREDAEDALDRMCDQIEQYGEVTIGYFYDICGETVPGDFTSEDWGWTNLRDARVVRDGRKGYYIDFPRSKAL